MYLFYGAGDKFKLVGKHKRVMMLIQRGKVRVGIQETLTGQPDFTEILQCRLPGGISMGLIVEAVEVGPMQVLCYVLGCPPTRTGLLIDPAAASDAIREIIQRHQLQIRWIVNTHGHPDHTAGNEYWRQATGAQTVMHHLDWEFFSTPDMQQAAEAEGFPPLTAIDLKVQDDERLALGDLELQVLHTPGHTPGSICLYTPGHLFTGDTLFVGAAGRTDLPGGSLATLIQSIQDKLLPLPEETIIWPGHDYGDTPTSTLKAEKENNPYITDFC